MKKTWEGINSLLHRKTKPAKCLSAVKDPTKNNRVIRDPSRIQDIFNKHFASVQIIIDQYHFYPILIEFSESYLYSKMISSIKAGAIIGDEKGLLYRRHSMASVNHILIRYFH